MPQVPRYSFEIDVNVAWGDMDALGHVNNVTYARYFETVRAEFFLNLKRRHNFEMPADRAMFMTSLHINYRRQLVFPARLTLTLGIGANTAVFSVATAFWRIGTRPATACGTAARCSV